jgi:hypothetical protein
MQRLRQIVFEVPGDFTYKVEVPGDFTYKAEAPGDFTYKAEVSRDRNSPHSLPAELPA